MAFIMGILISNQIYLSKSVHLYLHICNKNKLYCELLFHFGCYFMSLVQYGSETIGRRRAKKRRVGN